MHETKQGLKHILSLCYVYKAEAERSLETTKNPAYNSGASL